MLGGVMNELPNSPEALRAADIGAMARRLADENNPTVFANATAQLTADAEPVLTRILSDAGGNPSSMRLVMVLGVFVVLAAWATVSLQTHTLQPLPDSVVTLLSILTGGKLAQKMMEPKSTQLSSGPHGVPGDPAPAPVTCAHETRTEGSPQ